VAVETELYEFHGYQLPSLMKLMASHFHRADQILRPIKTTNKYAKIALWCVNRTAQASKNSANLACSDFCSHFW
jgi:Fe2+ transport system protein B